MDILPRLLQLLASNMFPLLAAIAGIAVAGVLWSRAPRPALLLLIASVLELVLRAASGWFYVVYLPQFLQSHSVTEMGSITMAVGVVLSLLQAADFGLLVWAIAVDRRAPAPPPAMRTG
jgi:hypothetical protein